MSDSDNRREGSDNRTDEDLNTDDHDNREDNEAELDDEQDAMDRVDERGDLFAESDPAGMPQDNIDAPEAFAEDGA